VKKCCSNCIRYIDCHAMGLTEKEEVAGVCRLPKHVQIIKNTDISGDNSRGILTYPNDYCDGFKPYRSD